MNRYIRQSVLPEIGAAGQGRLVGASALVVGAGGLGCPVLQYLAGAGVGRLIIVDHDKVEESNLHRQPLYTMQDIGRLKAQAAREAVLRFNPEIKVEALAERLTPQNVSALVARADIVVDSADSFAATYALSDACAAAKKLLISASVIGFEGYVGIFCGQGPSYRAVFPDMPARATSCAEAGVIGTAVGILGGLQAHLALHTLLNLAPVAYRLITFDARKLAFGSFDFSGAQEPLQALPFIAVADIKPDDIVVDLRAPDEAPVSPIGQALRLSVGNIEMLAPDLPANVRTILCCRSGVRSAQAARKLQALGIKNLALLALG